ncbi:MAG: NHL repeat-containing protein [Thermomicrobiales bacterium]|jgi:gluconolactonase|nr:NHL repeat-containing protein [Thermomicrobiales bacterium]
MAGKSWDITASLPETLLPISAFSAFVEGLDHPEGVATGSDGALYAGGEAGQVYRVSLDGTFKEIGSTGGFNLGLCLDASDNVYVCDNWAHVVKKVAPNGTVTTYSSGAPNRPMKTPNYPVFDAAGNLYVSDSGDWNANNGCVFRVASGGETEVFTTAVSAFPNGICLHPTGSHLYVVESQTSSVVRVEIGADGSAGAAEKVVELPHNVPDGVAFDEAGNLFISCYSPDVIYRLTPAGELDLLAADWERVTLAAPTNLAFCGPERKTLVVGSLGRWHLSKATMDIPGARLNYPVF